MLMFAEGLNLCWWCHIKAGDKARHCISTTIKPVQSCLCGLRNSQVQSRWSCIL